MLCPGDEIRASICQVTTAATRRAEEQGPCPNPPTSRSRDPETDRRGGRVQRVHVRDGWAHVEIIVTVYSACWEKATE